MELDLTQHQGKSLHDPPAPQQGRLPALSQRHDAKALAAGLQAPFLLGPYRDEVTQALGATTSRFHDAVTLLFHPPRSAPCACANTPNSSCAS